MADAAHTGKLEAFDASGYRVGVVVGLFNSHITGPMKECVIDVLSNDYVVPVQNITVAEVAGAADMPAVLESLARKDTIDCLIVLAAIVRGDTAHFDYVAKIVTDGVRDVQIKHAKPVAFGALTVEKEEHAIARIDHARSYAAAAIHAARTIKEIGEH